jgi:hypothetical protein
VLLGNRMWCVNYHLMLLSMKLYFGYVIVTAFNLMKPVKVAPSSYPLILLHSEINILRQCSLSYLFH